MKRFTTFVALFVCTMIISGSVVQLRAQGPTAVGGGGGATTHDAVYSGLSGNAVTTIWYALILAANE